MKATLLQYDKQSGDYYPYDGTFVLRAYQGNLWRILDAAGVEIFAGQEADKQPLSNSIVIQNVDVKYAVKLDEEARSFYENNMSQGAEQVEFKTTYESKTENHNPWIADVIFLGLGVIVAATIAFAKPKDKEKAKVQK